MSLRVLVDTDEAGTEIAHFDADGNLEAIERIEDVEPILDAAKAAFNLGLVNKASEFRRVGSYPPNVLKIFAKKWGIDPNTIIQRIGKDRELTSLLLNDRELSGFRTLPGTY